MISPIDISYFLLADQQRHEYILTDKAKSGDKFTFYIEAACNGMFGVGDAAMVPDPDRYFSIKTADLVVPNAPVQDLYYDLEYVVQHMYNATY